MPKRNRTRGMNAALATGEAGVGEMRPARSPMRPKQFGVALAAATVGSGLGMVTYHAVANKTTAFTGQVMPAHTYYLNFGSTGTVLTMTVKPGTFVTMGQVLATEDNSVAEANLAAAQTTVTADTAQVAADESPQANANQSAGDQLSLTQATAAVNSAQNALTLEQNNAQNSINQQTSVVNADQNTYNTDNGRYTSECSNSRSQGESCQTLQSQVSHDASTLSSAQAQLAALQSSTQMQEQHDVAALTQNQAVLTAAQQRVSAASQPLTPSVIAQAKAQLATAEAQVAADKLAVQNTSIIAPADGVVADTAGAVGDVVGPDGVHNYLGPAAQNGTQANQQPGFQLFAPQSNSGSGGASDTSQYAPLITLYTSPLDVVAQVPETSMSTIRTGQSAKVDITAIDTSVDGTVQMISLDPARVPGTTTYYDVTIALDSVQPQILCGMNVNVTLF